MNTERTAGDGPPSGEAVGLLVLNDHVLGLLDQNQRFNEQLRSMDGVRPIQTVGVVGAGFMGSCVAASAIEGGMSVAITDKDEAVLSRVHDSILAALKASGGQLDTAAANAVGERVRTTTDLADRARCDMVVECVVENPLLKRQIFSTLENLAGTDILLASNTSTLPIEQLSTELRRPDWFCGLHFFPPFGERPMLEIIPGPRSSDRTTEAMIGFSETIGRIPIVVADGRGFLVNCLLMAYMNAGMKLLVAGAALKEMERAALDFGMRVGPLAFYDLIGLDVAVNTGFSLAAESDAIVTRSPALLQLVKGRMLGRKTGAGFFLHDDVPDDAPVGRVNPRAAELIVRMTDETLSLSHDQLTNAILLPMVVEATRLIAAGRTRNAAQIDLAVMFGFGFPTWRGGLLKWADEIGAKAIVDSLESLAHLGPHLRPTPLLLEMADSGATFYEEA